MIQALREQLGDSASVVQRYQCSPYYTSSPFYPVVDLIERAAGLVRDDDADQKLDKLCAAVEALLPGDDQAPALVAALLSLPIDRFAPLEMTPQKQRLETIRVLVAQVEALASRGPVLMLFEDAHWCDPSTLELVGSIIDRVQSLPVLMLVTHRPEFTPSWTGYGHTTSYSLGVGLELTGQ